MIIKEGEPQLELDLPQMKTDQTFTCWNPKLKKYEKAHWIEKTGLSPHHFLYAIIGAPSSGKTLTPQPTFSVCLFLTTRIGYFYIYIH